VGEAPGAAIHSRRPTASAPPPCPPCLVASSRVEGRDMPKACVGPPTTKRSQGGTAPTSRTSSTVASPAPSAIASATDLVLPNADSTTTIVFIWFLLCPQFHGRVDSRRIPGPLVLRC